MKAFIFTIVTAILILVIGYQLGKKPPITLYNSHGKIIKNTIMKYSKDKQIIGFCRYKAPYMDDVLLRVERFNTVSGGVCAKEIKVYR